MWDIPTYFQSNKKKLIALLNCRTEKKSTLMSVNLLQLGDSPNIFHVWRAFIHKSSGEMLILNSVWVAASVNMAVGSPDELMSSSPPVLLTILEFMGLVSMKLAIFQ